MWSTPRAEDGERGKGSNFDGLPEDARSWATPAAQDGHNSSLPTSQVERDTLPGNVLPWIGPMPYPSAATTGPSDSSPAKLLKPSLNHRFGLWLQGFPAGWLDSAPSATPSSRKSRKSSGA